MKSILCFLKAVLGLFCASMAQADPLNDDFNGIIVDASGWHIPTWVSPTDGTYVGQTQFRCSQNAPLPAAIDSNAIIVLDTYNPTGSSFYGTDLISNQSFGQRIIFTVRAKMNAPIPPGIVGGIFLYAPPASTSNTLHDEIDFELLSSDPSHVYTNIYVSRHALAKNVWRKPALASNIIRLRVLPTL